MHERLPIYDTENDLIASLRSTEAACTASATGSGKSTQVPQMLLKHGLLGAGQCVVLQPRRLAAGCWRHASRANLGCSSGAGWLPVRFENVTSAATRIKFETEGILLRQLIADPTLRGDRHRLR